MCIHHYSRTRDLYSEQLTYSYYLKPILHISIYELFTGFEYTFDPSLTYSKPSRMSTKYIIMVVVIHMVIGL